MDYVFKLQCLQLLDHILKWIQVNALINAAQFINLTNLYL